MFGGDGLDILGSFVTWGTMIFLGISFLCCIFAVLIMWSLRTAKQPARPSEHTSSTDPS